MSNKQFLVSVVMPVYNNLKYESIPFLLVNEMFNQVLTGLICRECASEV